MTGEDAYEYGGDLQGADEKSYSYISRLKNPDLAEEALVADDSAITWLRSGGSPEIARATFAYSTNGSDWIDLGAGTRISNGWQFGGVSLPAGLSVRARGYVSVGQFIGPSWFVESCAVSGAPAIISQPMSRTNWNGTDATFSVSASGIQVSMVQGRD